MCKYSIVVPVYNVRPYLSHCFDSILKQTYQNVEVVIINDGSTDGSEGVCNDYVKKHHRFKVIHQENK